MRLPHSEKTIENFRDGLGGSGFDGAPKEINKKGKVPEDWWKDIAPEDWWMTETFREWWEDIAVSARFPKGSNNNIEYPTQKPEKLMERIIKCASKEGDVVLDPFVGGGTTVAVADRLNRRWIGIDQSVQAIKITEMRLNKQQGLFSLPFVSRLYKYDYNTLRYKDAFEFESWIVQQYGGLSNFKQRGDMGIDGKMRDGTPIQVKRSDNIGRNVIDNFLSAIGRYDKALCEKNKKAGEPIGILIAFTFGKGAIQEVARLKLEEGVIIKLVRVEDIVEIAQGPTLRLDVQGLVKDAKGCWEVQFEAKAQSGQKIEFFSWDWDFEEDTKIFKPEVYKDVDGKQVKKFEPGFHSIAVKVHDDQGLEAIEIIKLKVNGQVVKNPQLQAS